MVCGAISHFGALPLFQFEEKEKIGGERFRDVLEFFAEYTKSKWEGQRFTFVLVVLRGAVWSFAF